MPKLPEWKIERYIHGELPEDELQRIDRLRAADAVFDAEMRAKIDRLQASNQEILAKYPAAEMAAKIRARTGMEPENTEDRKIRPFFALPQVVFPAALAAALALFILFSGQFAFLGLPGGQAMQGLEGDTGIRLKGMEAGIQVFRKAGEEVEMLESGDQAADGDLLQLGFVAPAAEYAVLFSVDGRGVVTLHAPISARQSAELTTQQRVLIDAAYRLDDAPRFERFYLLTSESELEAAVVLQEVRNYIRRQGQFPSSADELNSNRQFADISEGQIKWYVFTLKK